MKHRRWIGLAALGIALVAAWHYLPRQAVSAKSADAAAAAAPVALVSTQVPERKELPLQIEGYGEVTTGQVDAVSFPRAGQVSRLMVTRGQRVPKGAVMATLATDPNVMSAYQQAVNAAALAQRELGRTRDLYDLKLATKSQVDTADKALRDAQSNLAVQRKLGGAASADTLTAPFDGIVTAVAVSAGDRIQPGATVVQLGHSDALRVQVGIEPAEAGKVRRGMPVRVTPLQNEAQVFTGTVTVVQDLLDPKTQLFTLLVTLSASAARDLVPGTKVRASISAGTQEGWVLPHQAVLVDDKGPYVFQVANGSAHRVQVTQLQDDGKVVAVGGPIQPEEPVVVVGNYELQDGMKVREGAR